MADDASRIAAPEADPLAWEAANRNRAGLSALAAAALTIIGSVVTGLTNSGAPKAEDRILTVVDTLQRAANGQASPPGHGPGPPEVHGRGDSRRHSAFHPPVGGRVPAAQHAWAAMA